VGNRRDEAAYLKIAVNFLVAKYINLISRGVFLYKCRSECRS